MSGRWSFFVDDRPWDGGRRLFMRVMSRDPETGRSRRGYVAPPALTFVAEGLPHDTPTLTQTREDLEDGVGDVNGFLQAALDAAWELGMRPTAYADHTNELKAVRYHLEDMRTLAKVSK